MNTAKKLVETEIDKIIDWIDHHSEYRDPAQAIDLAAKLHLWELLCEYGKKHERHDEHTEHAETSDNPGRHPRART